MTYPNQNWICCQLGAREHYAVPRSLHRHDALHRLFTDAWVWPVNPLGWLKPTLRARFHSELTSANVYSANGSNIAFELRAILRGVRGWQLILARNDWFQQVAVERLSRVAAVNGPQTVMAYSYAAREIFRFARERGWRTVLGQIDPGPPEERIVANLHQADDALRGGWRPPPPRYWSLWRDECALADRIVVNSRWSFQSLMQEGVSPEKLRVIPLAYEEANGTDGFYRTYPKKFTHSRPLKVLFLGQINLRKGIGPLLEAINLLRGLSIEFSFVGPVQISIPTELRHDPRVHWIGAVRRQDTGRFYRDADVFIFPTFSDGFGLTQLEAQAWKLPVIASKFCGEVVENGRNGWLLTEVTSSAIVATLRRCLEDPARLQQLSECSAGFESFNLDRIGKQWLNILD